MLASRILYVLVVSCLWTFCFERDQHLLFCSANPVNNDPWTITNPFEAVGHDKSEDFLSELIRQDSSNSGTCQALNSTVCAAICVPLDQGATNFSCGDWFTQSTCCNGTVVVTFPTGNYYECWCKDDGITGAGIAVIVCSVVLGLGMIAAVWWFVMYRKKKLYSAAKEEFDIAVEEALDYLPR